MSAFDPYLPPGPVVRPLRTDPRGELGPTRGQAAGPGWRRSSQGFYVPASVDGSTPEQRVAEAAARLPRGAAVTGWGSLRFHGGAYFDGVVAGRQSLVLLCFGTTGQGRASGVQVTREPLEGSEVVEVMGIAVTRPVRALFDELRQIRDLRSQVVAIDMAAAAGLVTVSEMAGYVEARRGWRRTRGLRAALALASERSRSPQEPRLRLVWELDVGLPRPLVNQPVFDLRGKHLGTPDLLDPVAGLVGEYDGADHLRSRRRARDLDRETSFRDVGLEYVAVTGYDTRRPAVIVERIRSAYARSAFTPPEQRRWTLRSPVGWTPDLTLSEEHTLLRMLGEGL